MNFAYIPDIDSPLMDAIARDPQASLYEIRRAHPSLRAMSMDHLALRIDQINHSRNPPSQK